MKKLFGDSSILRDDDDYVDCEPNGIVDLDCRDVIFCDGCQRSYHVAVVSREKNHLLVYLILLKVY